ncbi:DUF3375 domain-containing protein [Auritidibacter ignavus]|uniref:DUF3375 domain-containing protein n=1 Tax=Auritidibacter ignavus TaxID=678932 RepID=UPI002FE5ABF1
MDTEQIDRLRRLNPAWKLLRAQNAPLILSFLGRHFIEENHGATAASTLAGALDDELYGLNDQAFSLDEPAPYPKDPTDYLEDWAADDSGWLRRFYPVDSDELHYDATPALEKAYSWVLGLQVRPFVATESRLQTIVELLRQISMGSEEDPEERIAELKRRRDSIDREIRQIDEDPQFGMLDGTRLRDRYQQFTSTARELLADFRQVEENFRSLDRSAREKIATWQGSRGELLDELVSTRANIDSSDQGRSFQAFYDLLLSKARQEELSELLGRVSELAQIQTDSRLRTIHHDWADAAERTQQTVRQISEQFRRFLDDQIWVENRRVLELVKDIERHAVDVRTQAPKKDSPVGIEVDVPGIDVALPLERPLYDVRPTAEVDSLLQPSEAENVDTTALTSQVFVDQTKLLSQLAAIIPQGESALLDDIVQMYPIEQGVSELIGYLSLPAEDVQVNINDDVESTIEAQDDELTYQVRLAQIKVTRS